MPLLQDNVNRTIMAVGIYHWAEFALRGGGLYSLVPMVKYCQRRGFIMRMGVIAWVGLLFLPMGCSSLNKSSLDKKKAELYFNQGTTELVNERYTKALEYLLKARKLSPNDTRIYNNLGMSYYFKGRQEEAQTYLKKSIKLDGRNSDARNNLAGIYLEQGDWEAARREYREVLKDLLYDSQYRTYYNLALLDLRQRRVNSAIGYLKKSLEDKSDYCPALYQLGLLEKQKSNYLKALEYFQEGIKGACYERPAPHLQLGVVWEELGEIGKAENKYKDVAKRFPKTEYASLANRRLKNLSVKGTERLGSSEEKPLPPLNF